MQKLNFDNKVNSLARNHATFKRLLLLMILANIILLLILATTINKEKIILVPQVAPQDKLWVSNSQVSNEYLAVISRNALDLMLNITPSNVLAQHQELLKLVDSQYHDSLKSKLSDIAKTIIQDGISQNFYINGIRILHDKNVVYIDGSLNEYIDKTLSSTVNQIYKLSFNVNNYSVQLTNFELLNSTSFTNDPQLKDLQHD